MLEVKKVSYEGYEAYQLQNNKISLIVLPEVGGRIVSYNSYNHEFLYTIPELKGREYNLEGIVDIEAYRRDLDYVPAGGYKTWLAPQSEWGWPPYLDLAIGDYEVNYQIEKGRLNFELISPRCRETGMRLTRNIVLIANQNQVVIDQGMKNCSSTIKEYGLWDVTQIKGEGQIIFPIENKDDLSFFNQSQDNSEIEIIESDNNLLAVIDCMGEKEFKLGTLFSAGWVLTLMETDNKKLGYLKKFPVFNNSKFGHDCAIEIFDTSKYNYFEVEVHGPMTKLATGEETSFKEQWTTYSWQQDASLEEIILELDI